MINDDNQANPEEKSVGISPAKLVYHYIPGELDPQITNYGDLVVTPLFLKIALVAKDIQSRHFFLLLLDLETVHQMAQLNRVSHFFFQPGLHLRNKLLEAARFILSDYPNPYALEPLVQINPRMLTHPVRTVWRGRRIEGTLLQIAAMAGDVNLRNKQGNEKDHGIVEQLCGYLPADEAQRQLQAVFPAGWEAITAARMQPYVNAAATFMEGVIQARAVTSEALLTECQVLLENYKKALNTHTDEVIVCGYIFDPNILVTVMDLVKANIVHFGGAGLPNFKSDFFWRYGFGAMQASLLGCDHQAIMQGITVYLKAMIDGAPMITRLLNSSVPEHVAKSFYMGVDGIPSPDGDILDTLVGGLWDMSMKIYSQQKRQTLQNLCHLQATTQSVAVLRLR
jgi:hypothetical protein